LSQLYDDLDAAKDPDKQERIRRRFNIAYREMAAMTSWQRLRRTKTLTFTAQAAGVLLPFNLAGIDAIYNTDNGIFNRREKGQIGITEDECYRWAIVSVTTTPLASAASGVNADKRSSTISGLTTDYTGEFIVFDKRIGVYELTSQNTISPEFMEEKVSNGGYRIRPEGAMYLNCYDTEGNPITGSVTLDYWVYPQPITDDSQTIMFPTSDALAMFVVNRFIGLTNIDPIRASQYRKEFETAYGRMLDMNPIYVTPNIPVGRGGTAATWGAL
jgi:hypothetical protein